MSIRSESCCKGNRHEHTRKKKERGKEARGGKRRRRKRKKRKDKEYQEIRSNRPVERVMWKQKGEKQGNFIPQNKID